MSRTPLSALAGRSAARRGITGTLARRSAAHPWITLAVWVALLAAAVVAASGLGDVLTQDGELLVDTDAETAAELIEGAFADVEDPMTEFVVVESADPGIAADPALAALADDLASLQGVQQVTGPHLGIPQLVDATGTVALLQLTYGPGGDVEARAVALLERLEGHPSPFALSAFGQGTVGHEFTELAESNLRQAEVLGLPVALVILVLVFGALAAAAVPIVLAVAAIIGAVGLTTLVGQVTDLSFFVVNMITMIGLAVGIDYSLFIIQRYREERAAGRTVPDAIDVAGATASRAVLFSGVTVVIALLGLLLVPDTVMRSLGIGAVVVVVAAVAASLTLLPAVLALLGDRVDALRLPWVRRSAVGSGPLAHRFWDRITRVVTARPVVSVVLAGGLLVGLAVPYLTIELGQNGIASLPDGSPARHAFEVMGDRFPSGAVQTPIAVTGDLDHPATVAAIDELVVALQADEVFGEVTTTRSPDGELVLVEAATLIDPSTVAGMEHVAALRDVTIPTVFEGVPAQALVTGEAAFNLDYRDVVTGRTPLVFAVVLSLSFLLLLVAFRSVVVPLKAIVMNLLSVGAAYGLLVAVFQHGIGAELFGFRQVDVIETWIPVFLFAVLFGLSMDYHVFLLSRIKERFDVTGDSSASVAFGLGATGAIITGAAAIMVAVFGGFAAGELVMMQQMGFGLGVAVILDATIVRSVLVPATMELLGDRNWYLPTWLEWLPRIAVEGHVDDVEIVLEQQPEPVAA